MITQIKEKQFTVPEENVNVVYQKSERPPRDMQLRDCCWIWPQHRESTTLNVSLLRTNKLIYRDFEEVIYRTNQFVFSTPNGFSLWIGGRSENQMRQLNYVGFEADWIGKLDQFTNFHKVLPIHILNHGSLLNPKFAHIHISFSWSSTSWADQEHSLYT